MGKGARYRVPFRRRRQNRTDYHIRKALVASNVPRLVVRGSLKYMEAQIVEADLVGDKLLVSANSRNLAVFGWKAPAGNVPAAYLTGYLLGKKANVMGVNEAILDTGLVKTSVGARVFATLKGAVDSGLSVPFGEKAIPSESRIKGEHISLYAKQMAETDHNLYGRMFANYLSKNLRPEDIVSHWNEVKEKIDIAFKEEK